MILRLKHVKRVRAKGRTYWYHRLTGERLPTDREERAARVLEINRTTRGTAVRKFDRYYYVSQISRSFGRPKVEELSAPAHIGVKIRLEESYIGHQSALRVDSLDSKDRGRVRVHEGQRDVLEESRPEVRLVEGPEDAYLN